MSVYRLTLEIRSLLGTPLAADTLFGHVCWGLAYERGPEFLGEFLRLMNEPNPPLVISDPAPAGHLPMPALPPPSPEQFERLIAETQLNGPLAGCDRWQAIERLDVLAAGDWLPVEILSGAIGRLSMESVLHGLIRWTKELPSPLRTGTVRRAEVARRGGDDGPAVAHDAPAYGTDGASRFDVHVSTPWPADRIKAVFEQALAGGYGRDASIGMGHLHVESVEESRLPGGGSPNGVLALGAFAPRADDPSTGYWRLTTRFGRLGGAWSQDEQVHKYPVIMLRAGAVLRSDAPPAALGRMVHNVHPQRSEVQQYGLTLGLPVHLAD